MEHKILFKCDMNKNEKELIDFKKTILKQSGIHLGQSGEEPYKAIKVGDKIIACVYYENFDDEILIGVIDGYKRKGFGSYLVKEILKTNLRAKANICSEESEMLFKKLGFDIYYDENNQTKIAKY
jgi:hypothetical protein